MMIRQPFVLLQEVSVKYDAISADDFLPLFTFVLV